MVLTINHQMLTLPKEGDYAFHILIDNLEMGRIPIEVVRVEPGGATPEETPKADS